MRIGWGVVALGAALAAAACSSTSGGGPTAPQPTVTVTATQTVGTTPSATPSPTATSGATNLFLTPTIRRALLDARAKEVGVPDSAFVALYKGSAYYALDNSTGIYWAAGSTVPSRHSMRAEVASQDEGGYIVFELKPGSGWQVFDTGLDGPNAREGGQCPVQIPADVLTVWHWAPNTCDPPNGV